MGFFDAFFKGGAKKSQGIATSPVTLSVLFGAQTQFSSETLTRALQNVHPSLRRATFEIGLTTEDGGSQLGVASWGAHSVKVVAFNFPMPSDAVEECVFPSHYDDEIKERARAHQAHALLYYGGRERDVLEQYIALELVAAALCSPDGLVVLNPNALTSLPASVLLDEEMDRLEFLRSIPLLYLPCGFVKYHLPDDGGVFMRTHGAHIFGVPDLATTVESYKQGSELFDTFNSVLDYMRQKGPILKAGHTMQVGEDLFMKLREPAEHENVFAGQHPFLVAEFISQSEINPHIHP